MVMASVSRGAKVSERVTRSEEEEGGAVMKGVKLESGRAGLQLTSSSGPSSGATAPVRL